MFDRNQVRSWLLMVAAVAVAFWSVNVGTDAEPNTEASTILQAVSFVLGIVASWQFGRQAAVEADRNDIRTHASSAWRRMRQLVGGLVRQREAIAVQSDRLAALESEGEVALEHVKASLNLLDVVVLEQMATARDSLVDWQELVPDEYRQLQEDLDAVKDDEHD